MLMAMDGLIVHEWRGPPGTSVFHTVRMDADGNLFAVYGPTFSNGFDNGNNAAPRVDGVIKLNWRSRIVWHLRGFFTHHIELNPDGTLFLIRDAFRRVDVHGTPAEIVDDEIVHVSATGKELSSQSMFGLFGSSIDEKAKADVLAVPHRQRDRWGVADLLHTNHMELLPREVPHLGAKGDWLISIRNLSLVAVVDGATKKKKWYAGAPLFVRQHQPSVTSDDTLLLFDNNPPRGQSRVIEIDPKTKKVVWQYPRDLSDAFFSDVRGGAQRLPNGNTLITLSGKGRLMEVDRQGRLLWDHYSKLRPGGSSRVAPYRVERLMPESLFAVPFTAEQRRVLTLAGYLSTNPR